MKILLLFSYKLNKNWIALIKRHSCGFSPKLFFRYTKYMEKKECRRGNLKIEVYICYSIQSVTLTLISKSLRINRCSSYLVSFYSYCFVFFQFHDGRDVWGGKERGFLCFSLKMSKQNEKRYTFYFFICFCFVGVFGFLVFLMKEKIPAGLAICMFKSSDV